MGHSSSVTARRLTSTEPPSQSITPLYQACQHGDEDTVRELLPKYTHHDLNRAEPLYGKNTCLHVATANGHEQIVKLLLQHGCYRSAVLNTQKQSAYDIAAQKSDSTRLLYLRQDARTSSSHFSLRFYEANGADCFDIVRVDVDDAGDIAQIRKPSMQTYKSEDEIKHAVEYSASSKAMCQSRLGRFCINHLHDDDPLDHRTIIKCLSGLLEQIETKQLDDNVKANDLLEQYAKTPDDIEHLLHLYTLETSFYRRLADDCLPLAIPLFIHLPKLKNRFFKGRVYRGMHLTYDQLMAYQLAMEIRGTLLQTRSFSSTSMNRLIAEQFAYENIHSHEKDLHVLFIFDFPQHCDQAINLARVSPEIPCLSEYEDEEEVLILPWTLFEVTRIRKANDEDDLYTIHLTNIIIPNKNLLSTFKWSWVELRNQFMKEKKLKFDCGFQKYKTTTTTTKDK